MGFPSRWMDVAVCLLQEAALFVAGDRSFDTHPSADTACVDDLVQPLDAPLVVVAVDANRRTILRRELPNLAGLNLAPTATGGMPGTITAQPLSQTVVQSTNVSLSVTAAGGSASISAARSNASPAVIP